MTFYQVLLTSESYKIFSEAFYLLQTFAGLVTIGIISIGFKSHFGQLTEASGTLKNWGQLFKALLA